MVSEVFISVEEVAFKRPDQVWATKAVPNVSIPKQVSIISEVAFGISNLG